VINPVKQIEHFFMGGVVKLDRKVGQGKARQQNDRQNND
jgi:hypothetical protein